MKIFVVIPTVRGATVGDAVRSIRAQVHQDWELAVVSQGDDPSLSRALKNVLADEPRGRVIHLPRRGVSLARNAGIQASSGEVVALMDDDCEARPDWLAVLSSIFESEPEVDVVGGALLAPPRLRDGPWSCPQAQPQEIFYDPWAHGCVAPPGFDILTANLAVRRRAIGLVGGFDEHLGPGTDFAAGEDPDFVLRLEARGIKMRSTPRAVVVHTHGTRYGLKAAHSVLRGYAEGQGALAAKLTMMGDPRGTMRLRRAATDVLASGRRAPTNLVRAAYLVDAFRRCTRDYRIDPSGQLLERR